MLLTCSINVKRSFLLSHVTMMIQRIESKCIQEWLLLSRYAIIKKSSFIEKS